MNISLKDVLHWKNWRAIITINVDYLDNSKTQVAESYQVIQDTKGGKYGAIHQMGSKAVGLIYVGDDFRAAARECINHID